MLSCRNTDILAIKPEHRVVVEPTVNSEAQKSLEADTADEQRDDTMESLAKGGSLFKKGTISQSQSTGKKDSNDACEIFCILVKGIRLTVYPGSALTSSEETKMMADVAKLNSLSIRYNKFKAMLELPNIDLGMEYV